MNVIHMRLHVARDGTVTGHVPETVSPGEHDVDIVLHPVVAAVNATEARATIRALQEELSRLPVLYSRPEAEVARQRTVLGEEVA
jgi:hypothetical protein